MPVGAVVGSTIIGVGASAAAANSQSKAIKNATAAETAASEANIAATERERARNEDLFRPYIGQGDKAQAYLDALMYGEGSYGGAPSSPSSYAGGGEYDWDAHLRNNPDIAAEAERMVGLGHFPSVQAYAQHHYETFGVTGGHAPPPTFAQTQAGGPGAPGTTVSRQDVLDQIEQSPLNAYAQQDWWRRTDIAQRNHDGAYDLADREYADLSDVTEGNYDNAVKLAGDARTGRRDLAYSNLTQRLENNAAAYDAWDAVAKDQLGKAIDLNFSRGGVTGQVGATRRGVTDAGQSYALDAYGRRTALDADAYNPYYADVTAAEDTYWGDRGAAENNRSQARTYNTSQRSGRRQNAYDARANAYVRNYDTYAGDRLNAYGDYVSGLQGNADRGFDARRSVASYGQAATSANNQQRSSAARSAADASYARGAVQQQLYSDVAQIAGDAYGSFVNTQNSKNAKEPGRYYY